MMCGMLMYGGSVVRGPNSRETIEPIDGYRWLFGIRVLPSGKSAR